MIRADGDALVDVLLVVRVVDPVLELEELRVGERRDLRVYLSTPSTSLALHAMVALLFHLDAVDAMLSRTSSRHGTPPPPRHAVAATLDKDAVSRTRGESVQFAAALCVRAVQIGHYGSYASRR